MRTRVFKKVIYHLQLSKGFNAEKKALQAIITYRHELPWVASVRMSNWIEDRQGVDLVVKTVDIGKILLQIKSSQAGVEKFKTKYPRKLIGILIVHEEWPDIKVWRLAKHELIKLREEVLSKRQA